jgi:transposase
VAADRLSGRGAGAPSKTAPYAEQVSALLAAQPRLPTMEILRRARGDWGYGGGDSAFFNLVRRLRPAAVPAEPLVRFEGLPGEFAQFDFGQVELVYADGAADRAHFFAGCLKYSRFKHVVVTENEQAESLVRSTVDCLEAFGGAPKQWVYDNPKTVWVARKGGGRILNPYLRQLVAELNVLVEPCSPHSGNQKGAVENLVGFVKKNFFLARTFANRADMLRQLAEWLHQVNFERASAATGEIPAVRREQELSRLNARPIPWSADDFPLRETATVRPTGAVRYRGSGYSVDPRYLGAPATLLVGAKRIRIEVGRSHCAHLRRDGTDEIFRLPEHSLTMASMITAERKQTYFKRQCLLELGTEAQVFLDRLIMRADGNDWYRDIHRLFDFYQEHGQSSLQAAMAEAKAAGEYSARAVSRRLKGVG